MIEKHVVYHGDAVVAMKYNEMRRELFVGGNKFFSQVMEFIITEYFQAPLPKVTTVNTSKIRFKVYNMSPERYRTGKALLLEHGIVLDHRRSLERIMR